MQVANKIMQVAHVFMFLCATCIFNCMIRSGIVIEYETQQELVSISARVLFNQSVRVV